MSLIRRWSIAACLLLSVVVGAPANADNAQEAGRGQLRLIPSVPGSSPRAEGLNFDLFGTRASADLVFAFQNDSEDIIVVPASFPDQISLTLERDGRAFPMKVQWVSTEVSRADDEFASVTFAAPLTVEPEGVLRLTARLTPQGRDVFPAGTYVVSLNTMKAADRIERARGGPWRGHHPGEGTVTINIIDPQTPEELRRADLTAGNDALSRDDAASAVKHFEELVRRNPADLEAQAGAGQAYLDLKRYKEAAAAFELVLPSLRRGERSLLYTQAAFAYLALGQDGRAQQILTAAYGAESAKRQLAELREALRGR